MPCNEPNVIVRDNEEDVPIMDSAISGDRNVITKDTEKISKCKHLTIVIKHMGNLNKKSTE
jgi:azurin